MGPSHSHWVHYIISATVELTYMASNVLGADSYFQINGTFHLQSHSKMACYGWSPSKIITHINTTRKYDPVSFPMCFYETWMIINSTTDISNFRWITIVKRNCIYWHCNMHLQMTIMLSSFKFIILINATQNTIRTIDRAFLSAKNDHCTLFSPFKTIYLRFTHHKQVQTSLGL